MMTGGLMICFENPALLALSCVEPMLMWLVVVAVLCGLGAWVVIALNRRRRVAPYTTWAGFFAWQFVRNYTRIMHRPTFEHLDRAQAVFDSDEPIILVANHTCAVDPLILCSFLPRKIHWIMLRSFNIGPARFFTAVSNTIFVDQSGNDLEGLRQAVRVLKDRGVLGIFPEGGIARPPETIHPFQSGVGFLIRRTRARVVPIWVSGTPKVNHTMMSLIIPSRARFVFGEPMEFEGERDIEKITNQLRERLHEMSGWPMVDEEA